MTLRLLHQTNVASLSTSVGAPDGPQIEGEATQSLFASDTMAAVIM